MQNLTKYQASMIIKDAEIRIAANMKEASELEPQVKEYYEAYVSLKDRLDSAKQRITDDRQLLEMASMEKNGIKPGSNFRVLRSESHNDMKDREKKKYKTSGIRNPWTQWGIEILTEVNAFLTTDQLWDIVCQKHDIPVDSRSQYKGGAVHKCWLKTPKLLKYKEKIGLLEWQDNPGMHYRNIV